MAKEIRCTNCKAKVSHGVEYSWKHPEHYDGVSEWVCENGCRVGAWSDRLLKEGEYENRFGRLHKQTQVKRLTECILKEVKE